MSKVRSRKEREGELIAAFIPDISKTVIQQVRLHRVEDAGLWLESQVVTNSSLAALNVQSARKTVVYFFPWHKITYLFDSIDLPAFADSAAE